MYSTFKQLFAAVIIVLMNLIGGVSAEGQTMSQQFASRLEQAMDSNMKAQSMNGITSGVVFPDGSIWSAAGGRYYDAGVKPLHTDLLYDIGSNTKSMVAIIILQLEEEGKLSLEDTIYKYLSPMPNISYGITIRQLLEHKSGVADFTVNPDFQAIVNGPDYYQFISPVRVLSDFVSSPDFSPGSGFKYSSTGYTLLGRIIEEVEQKSFAASLKDRILDPLGLNRMFLDRYQTLTLPKVGVWHSANNYDTSNYVSFMSAAWAAGGVVSHPEDFAIYAKAIGDGQLLSQTAMDKIFQSTTSTSIGYFGLGLVKRKINGVTYWLHGGTTLQQSEMHYSQRSKFSWQKIR